MSNKVVFFSLALLLFCASCHKEEPPIPEQKFEEILYAMHKAEAYLDYNTVLYTNYQFKANYHHTILNEHNITRAEFDTAIVWYVSHMDHYKDLYTRLATRFKADKEKILEQQEELRKYISPDGDSVNIWKEDKTCIITPFSHNDKLLFRYNNDFNYHNGDRFYLRFKPILSKTEANLPTLDFSITYTNDSVQYVSQPLISGKYTEMMLPSESYYSVNFVSGAIRYTDSNTLYQPLVIADMELWRVRQQREQPQTTPTETPAVQTEAAN